MCIFSFIKICVGVQENSHKVRITIPDGVTKFCKSGSITVSSKNIPNINKVVLLYAYLKQI